MRERVALIIQVAEALQAAHQRLVVHRDVKPSNVIVDRNGVPKLLDFGIAKLLDPNAGREAETRTGMVAFTTEYASPEQVRGETVSVAADVYSLGAVLYDVLVGHPPQRAGATPLETLQNICERDPVRPSAAVPAPLRRELVGDLDNILLKALAKPPERRYASMADFARDLRAYLAGLPVAARDATFGYRARKLLVRHRGKLALAGVIVAALSTATVLSIAEARRADRHAQRAEEQRRILLVERGRQELASGHAGRALPYLAEALRGGADTPAVRLLISSAMHPFENRLATMKSVEGFTTAEWSPDGSRIAVGSMTSHGNLYRADGTLVATFVGDGSYQGRLVFSADSQELAGLDGYGRVSIWAATTGARQHTFDAHPATPTQDMQAGGVAFLDGGKRLVTGGPDRRIALWDVASGTRIAAADVGAAVSALAVSPDGSIVVVATRGGRLALWDARSLAPVGVLRELRGDIYRLVFSFDGAWLYSGGAADGVQIWDFAARKAVASLPAQTFDLDVTGSRLATGNDDGLGRIWDAHTGALQLDLIGHERNSIHSVQWSRDSRLIATTSRDGTFRIWDAISGAPLSVLESMSGRGSAPHAVAWPQTATFSPDSKLVLTLWGNGAALWRVDRGALVDEIPTKTLLYAASWSPDERRIAASAIRILTLWTDGHRTASIPFTAERLFDANWSPDGMRLVVVGESATSVVLHADGSLAFALTGHTNDVYRASFSPDGSRIATASADRTARIWNAKTGEELRVLEHPGSVMAAAWSPDGTHLATAGWDHHLRVWNAVTGALEHDLDGGAVHYLDVTFSPDQRSLAASGSGGEAEVWDLGSRARRLALEGHSANVTIAVWSPDGALIATSSSDHSARIWDAATGALLSSFPHPSEVMSAQWSRDGTRLLTACIEGGARIWDVHRTKASPVEVNAFVAERVPYKLVDGRLEHVREATAPQRD